MPALPLATRAHFLAAALQSSAEFVNLQLPVIALMTP
jgi:hypothetical protein